MTTAVRAQQGLGRRARSTFGHSTLGFVLLVLVLAAACSVDSDKTESEGRTSTTTAASAVTSTPLLLNDGLGDVRFGEPADTALPLLIDVLGRQPTDDSTSTGDLPQGFSGTAVRFVTFGPLTVIISDGTYYRDDGVMHFAGWSLAGTGPSELATPQGVTLGATVEELQSAFGDQLHLPTELSPCTDTWLFSVGPSELGFEGDLSDPPNDGSSSVTRLAAGAQSSC
jgi:hypothetical protein